MLSVHCDRGILYSTPRADYSRVSHRERVSGDALVVYFRVIHRKIATRHLCSKSRGGIIRRDRKEPRTFCSNSKHFNIFNYFGLSGNPQDPQELRHSSGSIFVTITPT